MQFSLLYCRNIKWNLISVGQVIQVVPIHDAVYQFCERNLDKIRKYMASVLVRFPLPARCAIERKNWKLSAVHA